MPGTDRDLWWLHLPQGLSVENRVQPDPWRPTTLSGRENEPQPRAELNARVPSLSDRARDAMLRIGMNQQAARGPSNALLRRYGKVQPCQRDE